MEVGGPRTVVVVVCRTNRVVSVVTEHVLRDAFVRAGLDYQVVSAGLVAVDGERMDRTVADFLVRVGSTPSPGWTAKRLERHTVESGSLVLTVDRACSVEVTGMVPRSVRSVHTLPQMARLLRALEPELLSRVLPTPSPRDRLEDAVRVARGHVQPVPEDDLDLVDPGVPLGVGSSRAAERVRRTGEEIALGLVRVARVKGPVGRHVPTHRPPPRRPSAAASAVPGP